LSVGFSLGERKTNRQKVVKYLAAELPELVEGQAKIRVKKSLV